MTTVFDLLSVYDKAFRHVENLFIQRFLFIHPRFVFIVQGSLLVVQLYKPWMNKFLGKSKYSIIN